MSTRSTPTNQTTDVNAITQQVDQWLNDVVIGLNLCPFAAKPQRNKQIKIFVSEASQEEALLEDILLQLIAVADVHFTFNPSNHDYQSGFFLADVIQTYFQNNKNITFDCSIAHRKGYRYGNNLIGTTHGDGAKQADLPLLMAQEFPIEWSKTKHRYVYTHHVHHKLSKDYAGVTVESLRSPSATDSWHHRKGFQHAPQAVEGFIHHYQNGQIARLTHLF